MNKKQKHRLSPEEIKLLQEERERSLFLKMLNIKKINENKELEETIDEILIGLEKWLHILTQFDMSGFYNYSYDTEKKIGIVKVLNEDYAIFSWDEEEKRPYFILCFYDPHMIDLLYKQEFYEKANKKYLLKDDGRIERINLYESTNSG